MIKLSNQNLDALPQAIQRPTYDRSALSPGIVHIGLGNFHRAHQSWYLHRLMQQGRAHDWAIIGAGVRAYDSEMRSKLAAQDYMTSLLELHPGEHSVEVVGSMVDYLPVEDGNAALIAQMAEPAIRIVSLTVTEGGYYIDPVSGRFNATHEDIQYDALHPEQPRTAFGAIVRALQLRHEQGAGPFTCQSCDNLQGNGAVLRQAIVGLAALSDAALAAWIDSNCSFPNSMVDSIVPVTGNKERTLVREMGVDDAVPVSHERFRQWVIEDNFCAGRPDWQLVGATFSDNVHGFENQKIHLLNAGHQVLANVAQVLGIETISGSMAHPAVRGFFRKVLLDEVVPHIDPVGDLSPEQYVELIDARFANAAIVDTTKRVAFDGSSRHTGFVLPIVRDALAAGTSVQGLALVEAAWARMCEGTREDGTIVEADDPFWDILNQRAREARTEPRRWLELRQFYGDLADEPRFADAFTQCLAALYQDGVEATLQSYLKAKE